MHNRVILARLLNDHSDNVVVKIHLMCCIGATLSCRPVLFSKC